MRKRITSILLTLLLCMQTNALAAFYDVDGDAEYAKAADRLNTLNIISGKEDGGFDPDGYVTRAEMAKIASIIADIDVQASDSSLFSDMEEGNWANGYVNTVATNGIILGYPDGTFQPDKNMTYAETITITLRLLGYDSKILGNNYPGAYLQKAKELSLTDDMSFYYDDYIDRKNMAVLIDRALVTNTYSSSSKKTKLIEGLDYSVSNECIIIATNNESKKLLSDEVVTSIGTYKKLNNNVDSYVTKTCKLLLDKDNKIVSVIPIEKQNNTYVVQNVTGNEVSSDNGVIKMDSSSVVYFKNEKTTFSAISDKIQTGTKMVIYYSTNGAYDYAVLTESELLGPVVYINTTDVAQLNIKTDGLRVIRDGNETNIYALKKYDVLYYDANSNILYSYCDTVSGIYEDAFPNKANVTSIKLSGETYALETQDAVKALGEKSDSFKINDYITALLGKDGKIAAIVRNESPDTTEDYGILLSCDERVKDGTLSYYATFLSSTGAQQEFKVSMNYDEYRGMVAEYNFENGVLMPFFVSENKIKGSIDRVNRKIGDYWLTSDCKVVDLEYAPGKVYEYDDDEIYEEDYDDDELKEFPDAVAKVIELNDITAYYLDKDEVINAQLDDNGNVAFLVLNNINMDRYKFGIVKDADKFSTSGTFKIDFGGTITSYSINEPTTANDNDVVMVDIQDNQMLEIREMDKVLTTGSFEAIDKQKVRLGSVNYTLAKDAVVFQKRSDDVFDVVAIDDVSKYNVSKMELYIDKDLYNGGLVRVIVFTEGAK